MAPRVVKRLGDAKGTAVLEAAIITPLFLLLTFAVADFGGLFYAYLALENGVSLASRYGITGRALDDPMNPGTPLDHTETMKLAMRQGTPTLTIPDGAFTFSHKPVSGGAWTNGPGAPGELERISVRYTWEFFTPLVGAFFENGEVTMQVDSAMKNEGAPE